MKSSQSRKKGFTLIEMLVVVTIIAILATLILPMIQRAQYEALKRKCMNIMGKTIHSAVMTYAATWAGTTSSDPGYYVKEHGYALSTEPNYDATQALQVDAFKCPMVTAAPPNNHGYPSSYLVQGAYLGIHVGSLKADATDLVMIIEDEKRHIDKKEEDGFKKFYCFGDGHVELGWSRSPMHGVVSKWYNTQSGADWTALKNDQDPSVSVGYETVWARALAESGFGFLPPTANGWGASGSAVDQITAVFTGLIQFPGGGTWYALERNDDWAYIAIDINEDDTFAGAEIGESRSCCRQHYLASYVNINPTIHYKFKAMFREGFGGNYMNFYWTQNTAAPSEPAAVDRVLIGGESLFHIPE
ncbi:MAG: prepilin-type N-terminal cleavage/methylation domain-containing protein [Planctomycetota bacterium]|jgi:prepilin-type N-terminal cleavage/methylation domain-containing protein|nr:prepilin-type N-terminal cleavage/methylation domain-containing protein [Planctomycetota bacterium]MDP7250594.1 prepilin-type N-terminal cleavage/methylation domain-containing protein [Planctomycetota bacterium]